MTLKQGKLYPIGIVARYYNTKKQIVIAEYKSGNMKAEKIGPKHEIKVSADEVLRIGPKIDRRPCRQKKSA